MPGRSAPLPLPRGKVSAFWHERFDGDPASRWLRERMAAVTVPLRSPPRAQLR